MGTGGHVLGIDFGTSNTAAGFLQDGRPRLITLAEGKTTIPTTFFFDFETRQTLIGEPANRALLDGADGRFMRALKRVLGTTLMHEKRQILNERVTFVDVIARFLAHVKSRAEHETGLSFERALSGRPVVFHGPNDPREDQAEADLRACYLAAGFKNVDFLPEPEAAAIASGALEQGSKLGLIVDIGGGTSDFSVFRSAGDGVSILANHGVRIGGTDFDRAISIDRVMPLLGKGTQLRKVIGPGLSPVQNAIFNDLATWEKIPFLYTGQERRAVDEMTRLAEEPEKLGRLAAVLRDQLGHDLAFAVEKGKIAVSSEGQLSHIALAAVERGLSVPLPALRLAEILEPYARQLNSGAEETVLQAGLTLDQIEQVIYVGGSSMMSMVTHTIQVLFPDAQHRFSEVFTAVAYGLALGSAAKNAA